MISLDQRPQSPRGCSAIPCLHNKYHCLFQKVRKSNTPLHKLINVYSVRKNSWPFKCSYLLVVMKIN